MKRFISVLLCISFLLLFSVDTLAANRYVVDDAGLMTAEESFEVGRRCTQFYADTGMELIILTVNSLDGKTAMEYADDYFDSNYGENGILLLITMAEREWHISTAGTSIEAFSDEDLMGMEDGIMKYLPDGKYAKAFNQFISDAEYYWNNQEISDFSASMAIALPIGAVIAAIVLLVMRSMMNFKGGQHNAAGYTSENSYHLHTNQDFFLYSNITRRAKPKENTSSGSRTHTSSSGSTHGGRGGKF